MSTASIQVVVQSAAGKVTDTLEVKPGAGSRGQTVRIQVQEGVRYQLKDLGLAGQKGPEVVKLKRVGKNLLINFEEGQSTADLVLENYYSEAFTQPASLVGESQNNRLYAYALEGNASSASITSLSEWQGSINAYLTGAEMGVGSGAAVGLAALSPSMLGASTLGAAVLGSNLTSDASSSTNAAAEAEAAAAAAAEAAAAAAANLATLMGQAQTAARAVDAASITLKESQAKLQAALQALGEPATPAQLAAVEAAQSTVNTAMAKLDSAASQLKQALADVAKAAESAGLP